MPNQNVLTEKENALVAIRASVAAGCQPCTAYLVKAARLAGACERGVSLAVETALAARESGATPEQIRAAIAIAGKVKRTAEEKLATAMGYQPACPEREAAARQPANCGCR